MEKRRIGLQRFDDLLFIFIVCRIGFRGGCQIFSLREDLSFLRPRQPMPLGKLLKQTIFCSTVGSSVVAHLHLRGQTQTIVFCIKRTISSLVKCVPRPRYCNENTCRRARERWTQEHRLGLHNRGVVVVVKGAIQRRTGAWLADWACDDIWTGLRPYGGGGGRCFEADSGQETTKSSETVLRRRPI